MSGSSALAAPVFVTNVENTGMPGIDGGTLMLWHAPQMFDGAPTLRVDRHAAGSGRPGYTYSALWGLSTAFAENAGYEWTIKGELHNQSLASTGSQNVAVNGTAYRESNGIGPTGPTWGGNFNAVDTSGESPPTQGLIGAEIDVGGGTGPDPNRTRVVIHAVPGGEPGAHVAYGLLVSPTEGVVNDRAIGLENGGGSFGVGLDLVPGSFSSAAVLLGPGQWIGFDGDRDGGFSRFLGFNPADRTLTYMTAGGPMLRFSDDGAARVGRLIQTLPHVPAGSSAPGEPGEQAWDADHLYVCVAPDTWRRAPLAAW